MRINKESILTLKEAINCAKWYNPIKIYYNRKCIWDDNLSAEEGWIDMNKAIEQFCGDRLIYIDSLKIKIVEWHHSIIYLKGKVYTERENNK